MGVFVRLGDRKDKRQKDLRLQLVYYYLEH